MLGQGIEQLCVFAVFCVLGVGLSALYILGVGLTKTRLAAIIFDCIFGAVAIYVIWKTNLEVNNGECRAFIFIGLALGVLITYVTCKRVLDKLSGMLYNLFTKVNNDGTDILQEVNSSDIRSGDTDTGIASLHAFGNADADVVVKGARRRPRRFNKTGAKRRRRSAKTYRRNELR